MTPVAAYRGALFISARPATLLRRMAGRLVAGRLVAGCLVAGLLTVGSVHAQQKTEVPFATLGPSALNWLHEIAKAEGFYAERGIEVKELIAGSSPALIQAISTESVAGGLAVPDLAMRAIDRGSPIVFTGGIVERSILRMVGAPGITEIKQLAGKPVTVGGVQGGTANLLRLMLKRNGVDHNGVKMVAVTNSRDRIVSLNNGQVQAALLIAPFDTIAMNAGMKVLDVYNEPYAQIALALNRNWASKNPKLAAGVTQAMRKAAVFILDPKNRQRAIDILAAHTKTDKDIIAHSYKFMIEEHKAIAPGLVMTAASLENLIKIDNAISANPTQDRPIDLAKYFDPSFLNAK